MCACVGHFVNQRAITRTVVCKCIKFIFHLLSCIKQPQSKFRAEVKKAKKEKHNAESLFHLAACVCVYVCAELPFGMQIKRQKWPKLPACCCCCCFPQTAAKKTSRVGEGKERKRERRRKRERGSKAEREVCSGKTPTETRNQANLSQTR